LCIVSTKTKHLDTKQKKQKKKTNKQKNRGITEHQSEKVSVQKRKQVVKRQPTEWRKICANYSSDKGLRIQ
jgi:hypothetical protein